MSAITATIDKYVNGDITFEALVEFLTGFDWTPPEEKPPSNPFWDMLGDGDDFPVDGSFHEVQIAYHLDKLSDEEFIALGEVHSGPG